MTTTTRRSDSGASRASGAKDTARHQPRAPSAVAITRDGSLLAAASNDGRVVLLRRDAPSLRYLFCVSLCRITSLSFSRGGARLALGGNDPHVYDVDAPLRGLTPTAFEAT